MLIEEIDLVFILPDTGFGLGLMANDPWIIALLDIIRNYFTGLSGSHIAIEAADTSPRYDD